MHTKDIYWHDSFTSLKRVVTPETALNNIIRQLRLVRLSLREVDTDDAAIRGKNPTRRKEREPLLM